MFEHVQYSRFLAASHPKWSASIKLVLGAIADHCNQSDEAWPSNSRIHMETGVAESTIKRAIARLKADNIISVRYAPGRPSIYHFPVPVDFDPKGNAHMSPENAHVPPPTQEEKKQAALERFIELSEEPDYAPYDSWEHKAEQEALFERCPDHLKMDLVRYQNNFALKRPAEFYAAFPEFTPQDVENLDPGDVSSLSKELPYDKTKREDGVVTPSNRYQYDRERD